MSSQSANGGTARFPPLERSTVLRAIVPARRRRVLSFLLDYPTPMDERALAASLAADDQDRAVASVRDEEANAARVDLRQVHLPALADAGLIAWNEAEATVDPTTHPGLRDPLIRRFLSDPAASSEDVIDALADRRRRTVLAVLQTEPEPLDVSALAGAVAAREGPAPDRDVLASLFHVHLPKLEAAGLIEVDEDDRVVDYLGHPAIEGPWFGWSSGGGCDAAGRQSRDPTNHESD